MAPWSSLGLMARHCLIPILQGFSSGTPVPPLCSGTRKGIFQWFLCQMLLSLLSAEPKLQWSCAWDGTALIGDPHYSQSYRKHPSLRRGGTPPHCIGPVGAKEGVGLNHSRLQDSIFFPSPSLLTYTHSLSHTHTHTHTHTRVRAHMP